MADSGRELFEVDVDAAGKRRQRPGQGMVKPASMRFAADTPFGVIAMR